MKKKGFTLIELMITIGITSLVFAGAFSLSASFRSFSDPLIDTKKGIVQLLYTVRENAFKNPGVFHQIEVNDNRIFVELDEEEVSGLDYSDQVQISLEGEPGFTFGEMADGGIILLTHGERTETIEISALGSIDY